MKHLFNFRIALGLCTVLGLGMFASSCDEIGMPYEKTKTVDTTDTGTVVKKVFLEEFTGATCQNCPGGHRIVASLREAFGEKFIAMSIHAGGFAKPEPPNYPSDFRTAAGDELNSTFEVQAYPNGMVNRSKFEDFVLQSTAAWATDVDSALRQTANIKLELSPSYTAASGDVAVTVKATAVKAFSSTKPLNIAYFVVEDSVIAPQLDGKTRIPAYVHRDVLRDSPLGAFGSELSSSTSWTKGTSVSKTFHTSLSGKTWDINHIKVIAIVCEKEPDYAVWQAEEASLIK